MRNRTSIARTAAAPPNFAVEVRMHVARLYILNSGRLMSLRGTAAYPRDDVKRRPTRGYRADVTRRARQGFDLISGAICVLGATVIACTPPAAKGVPPLPIVATPLSPAPAAPPE